MGKNWHTIVTNSEREFTKTMSSNSTAQGNLFDHHASLVLPVETTGTKKWAQFEVILESYMVIEDTNAVFNDDVNFTGMSKGRNQLNVWASNTSDKKSDEGEN